MTVFVVDFYASLHRKSRCRHRPRKRVIRYSRRSCSDDTSLNGPHARGGTTAGRRIPVIASASEAIQNLSAVTLWIASSLALLAMTSIHTSVFSQRVRVRVDPGKATSLERRGRRECRVLCCTRSLAWDEKNHTSVVTTGEAATSDIPCAMVLTLMFALSPVSMTF